MKRQLQLLIAIAGLFFVSWGAIDRFPTDKVKQTFVRLLSDSMGDISGNIRVSEVTPIVDSSFMVLLPNTDFYYLILHNGSHWEYNKGSIQTIAAVSKTDTNDVSLLLPQTYSNSSADFFNLFCGKSIKDKEKICKSITNLFLKTYTRSSFNCDKEMKDLHQVVFSTDNTFTVTTTWIENCLDLNKNIKEKNGYLESKMTIFSFEGDILINIDYKDWGK